MSSPKAAVLLGMDREGLRDLIRTRIFADRDPSDADIVRHLSSLVTNAGIDPARRPEFIDRRFPGLTLGDYVAAERRVHLERQRWGKVAALIGTRKTETDLTPETAEQLAALIDSWRPEAQSSPDEPRFAGLVDRVVDIHNMPAARIASGPRRDLTP